MTPLAVAKILGEVNQLETWLQNVAALVRSGEYEAAFDYAERVEKEAGTLVELIGENIEVWEKK